MIKKRRQNRLVIIAVAGAVLAIAVALTMTALNDQIAFFKSPTDIANQAVAQGTKLRIGGMVKVGSCIQIDETITFIVTDFENELSATHTGLRPDLFREGQGVVMDGVINEDGVFVAEQILAKHDENYMPAEVIEAMKGKMVVLTPSPDAKGDCA